MFKKVLFGVVIFMMMVSSAEAMKMVSVNRPNVNMRSGPGEKYSVMWELGEGFPLKMIATQGNWLKVEDFEGDSGWIYKDLVDREAHLIVKKKRVNVRSGPGDRYRLVGKANYGVVFKTLKNQKGWVKVKHENGLTGWVLRSLLWGW